MNNSEQSSYNRRDFIKTTSAIAAGLSLAPGVFAQHNDTLKIALIGCGGRGSGAANQALSTAGPVKLVAMADAFKDRLNESHDNLKKAHPDRVDVADDHKFIGFEAYKDAIALADVVILATPPGFRPMQFEEAVRQGKHIFTEKPVATDAPGVRRFLAAAAESKKKNLKVGVGLQRHHQAGYIDTIKRVQDGEIGEILSMRAYWDGNTPWVHPRELLEAQAGRKLTEMEYQLRNWYYFQWICGDHIVEQHIHNLDVINWVKGAHPVRAQGMGGCEVRKGPDYGEIFDHHFVEFQYPDGTYLSSQCRHILGCYNSVSEHVVGTKGKSDLNEFSLRDHANKLMRKFKEDHQKDPYQQEHDDLFDAIRTDKAYNEAEYGANSTMTAIMGRMATYSGKMLEWDAAINSKISLFPPELSWDADMPSNPDAHGMYKLPVPGKTVVV